MFLSVLFGVTAWLFYRSVAGPSTVLSDDSYYADIARHVAEGRGVTSSILFPAFLAAAPNTTPVDLNPSIVAPGYPLLLALAFRLGGANDASAFALQGFLFTALLILVYYIARRFLEPTGAALVVVLAALEPNLLEQASLIGTDLLFAVLVSLALGLVLWPPAVGTAWPLLAGCVLILAQLVRPNAVVLVPAFAAVAFTTTAPTRRLRRALAVCIPPATFLALAMLTVAGPSSAFSALSFLHATPSFPGWSLGTEFQIPSLTAVFTTYGGEMVAKEVAGIRYYLDAVPTLGSPLLVGGILLAAAQLTRVPTAKPLVLYTGLATSATIVVAALVEQSRRLLIFLLPVYLTVIVLALWTYVGGSRRVALLVLSLALVLYGGQTARLLREHADRVHDVAEVDDLLGRVTATGAGADGWIATDVPGLFSWRLGLPAVNLPADPAGLRTLEEHRRPVTTVVITSIAADKVPRGTFRDDSWRRILDGGSLPGYLVADRVDGRSVSAVILRAAPQ